MLEILSKDRKSVKKGKVNRPFDYDRVMIVRRSSPQGGTSGGSAGNIDVRGHANQIREGLLYYNGTIAIYKFAPKKVYIPQVRDGSGNTVGSIEARKGQQPGGYKVWMPPLYFIVNQESQQIYVAYEDNIIPPLSNLYGQEYISNTGFRELFTFLNGVDLACCRICLGSVLRSFPGDIWSRRKPALLDRISEICNTIISSAPNTDLPLKGKWRSVINYREDYLDLHLFYYGMSLSQAAVKTYPEFIEWYSKNNTQTINSLLRKLGVE